MKRNLKTDRPSKARKTANKLFRIRTTPHEIQLSENVNAKIAKVDYYSKKKAVLEAERKKAEAITILRRHAFIR